MIEVRRSGWHAFRKVEGKQKHLWLLLELNRYELELDLYELNLTMKSKRTQFLQAVSE